MSSDNRKGFKFIKTGLILLVAGGVLAIFLPNKLQTIFPIITSIGFLIIIIGGILSILEFLSKTIKALISSEVHSKEPQSSDNELITFTIETSFNDQPNIEEMTWTIENKSIGQYDSYLTDELLVKQLASTLPATEEFKSWAKKIS